jgi:hypothetical protein
LERFEAKQDTIRPSFTTLTGLMIHAIRPIGGVQARYLAAAARNETMTKVGVIPRVFISYSHDSEDHRARVLDLSNRLRSDGIDVRLDRYEASPSQGWPRWMLQQLKQADTVLCVCTETYRRRFDGEEDPNLGKGATWEGMLAQQLLYDSKLRKNKRFVPIVFDPASRDSIPLVLQQFTSFRLPSQYENLYADLTGRDVVPAAPLGATRSADPAVSAGLPDLEQDRDVREALGRLVDTLEWQRKWLPLLKFALSSLAVGAIAYAIVYKVLPPAPHPVVSLGISSKDAIVLRNESEHDATLKPAGFAVWVGDKPVQDWDQFLEQLGIYQEADRDWPEFLAAGKRKSILRVHGLDGSLRFYAERMTFEYCYCSERNDCWVVTGKPGALDTKKAACSKLRRFELPSK